MKMLFTLLIYAAFIVAPLSAAPSFEGRLTMRITSDGKTVDVAYATKGDKVRFEMPGEGKAAGAASIMDMGAREMMVLMPEQKMYMVMPIKDIVDAAADKAGAAQGTLEKTSETETILGYKATKYLAKSPESKEPVEIWAAEGLGFYVTPASGGSPMGGKGRQSAAWEKELMAKGFFPLRTVAKDKRGRVTRMEVVSLDKASLPDSLFKPPADYQKFSLPGGMGKLIPGFGGGK